jgi:hypothetical protein
MDGAPEKGEEHARFTMEVGWQVDGGRTGGGERDLLGDHARGKVGGLRDFVASDLGDVGLAAKVSVASATAVGAVATGDVSATPGRPPPSPTASSMVPITRPIAFTHLAGRTTRGQPPAIRVATAPIARGHSQGGLYPM